MSNPFVVHHKRLDRETGMPVRNASSVRTEFDRLDSATRFALAVGGTVRCKVQSEFGLKVLAATKGSR